MSHFKTCPAIVGMYAQSKEGSGGGEGRGEGGEEETLEGLCFTDIVFCNVYYSPCFAFKLF